MQIMLGSGFGSVCVAPKGVSELSEKYSIVITDSCFISPKKNTINGVKPHIIINTVIKNNDYVTTSDLVYLKAIEYIKPLVI